MKTNKNLIFLGLIVLLIAAYSGGYLGGLGTSSVGTGIETTSQKVLVPQVGVIRCVLSEASSNNTVGGGTIQGVSGYTFKKGSFDTDLGFPLCLSGSTAGYCANKPLQSFFAYPNWRDGTPENLQKTYVCSQGRCKIDNANVNEWFSCPSGTQKLYTVETHSGIVAQSVLNMQGNNSFSQTIVTPLSDNAATLEENDTLKLYATCASLIRPGDAIGAFGAQGYFVAPTNVNFNVKVFPKVLRVFVDGTQKNVSGTEGCLSNTIAASDKGIGKSTSTNNTLTDEDGVFGTIASIINKDPQAATTDQYVSSVPNSMQLGQDFAFIAGWKEVPAFGNVLALPDGTRVVRSFLNNRTLIKVKQLSLADGTSVNVAGDIYEENVQCLYPEECAQQAGSTKTCDLTTFTCQYTKDAPPAQCQTDLQCGASTFVTEGTQAKKVSYSCVSGQCQQNAQNVTCNPLATYPQNLCPASKPICDNSTQCIEQAVTKQVCPTDCCNDLSGSPFYTKTCPNGLVCKTQGGFSGSCIEEPIDSSCGDNICGVDEGKIIGINRCVIDCSEKACPVGQHLVTSTTQTYAIPIINLFPNPPVTEATCEPDINWTLILISAIIAVVAVGAIGLANKKGRRK